MALRRHKIIEQADAPSTREMRVRPKLASDGAQAVASPALELQARLAADLGDHPSADLGDQRRWSPAASLGFLAVTCGGFWTLVALGVSRLLH